MGNIYKEGQNRKQQMFFPPSIDEYVVVPEKPTSNTSERFYTFHSNTI